MNGVLKLGIYVVATGILTFVFAHAVAYFICKGIENNDGN